MYHVLKPSPEFLNPRPMGEVAPSDGAGAGPYPARWARFRNSGLLLLCSGAIRKEKNPKFHNRAQRAE
jgi:hypothetical protein